MSGFSTPWVLLFLLGIPLLLYLDHKVARKRKQDAIKFSNLSFLSSALGDKKKRRRLELPLYLSLSGIALMILGFANPYIPLSQAKEGVTVVLVLDVSGSMQATDYQPTRVEAAKSSAEVLLKSLDSKDSAGIVTFSDGATTAAYLSPFKDRVIDKLHSVRATNGNTAIGDGLSTGVDMALSIPNRRKVVILLSDGVNNAGAISPGDAVTFAKASGVQVDTIGLGTNGKTVLGYDWFGNPQYADLDEEALKTIAQDTGGKYFRSVDPGTLKGIYNSISKDIKREREETNIKTWFFLGALGLVLCALYVQYGPRRVIA